MRVEVLRDGNYKQVEQEELTADELCDLLDNIRIDSDEFIS